MNQPYETTPPPVPVHDEPDPGPSLPVSVEEEPTPPDPSTQGGPDPEDPFGWEPLETMTLEEKVDQTLILLRAFTDQVQGITSLVEQEGIGNLVTKAMTGSL